MAGSASPIAQFDYLAVGHVTIDVLPDGSSRPGGTALYGALQAARLGRRALIFTRGVPAQLERLLEPYSEELEVRIQPGPATTTLRTSWANGERHQQLIAWAGPIDLAGLPACDVLHLAPVAAELRCPPGSPARFVGMTPQGLVRHWPSGGGEVRLQAADVGAIEIARSCDALVLGRAERDACRDIVAAALARGASVAVTAAHEPTQILLPDATTIELEAPSVARAVDDLGAGDVYAAVLFLGLADGGSPAASAERAGRAASLRVLGLGPDAVARASEIEAGS